MNRSDFTVLIVEDEVLVAKDIGLILERWGYKTVGIADRMDKVVSLFAASRPNLVICDVRIKGAASGIDVIRRLRRSYSDFVVIYLTAYADDKTLEEALNTEPDSYLVKPFTDAQLRAAVSKAHHGFFSRRRDDSCPFSSRELDVLNLLKQGLTSKEVSDMLSISIQTVKSHRKNLIRKANVKNMTELIALSIRNHWLVQE